jgi:hypothetical protein
MTLETVFGLLLGVLIAAGWLVFKPVTIANAPPEPGKKPAERHAVFYITGHQGLGRSATTSAKQKAFLERTPGEIVLVEDDINRWIATTYQSLDLSKKWDTYSTELRPTLPLVRLVDSEIEIGMVCEAQFMDSKRKFVVQARGVFEKQDGREVFVPRKMFVGSCPVPAMQARWIYDSLASKFVIPDDVKTAWAAVQQAKIEQDKLKLTIAATGI